MQLELRRRQGWETSGARTNVVVWHSPISPRVRQPNQMGSYYRDDHIPFHHQSTFHTLDGQQPPIQDAQDLAQGPTRLCSVRGCTTVLPFEYSLKMCEQCRGRHRIYANTKRQKRKLEKMALGGQRDSVVWMPPNGDQDVHPEEQIEEDLPQQDQLEQVPAAPANPIPPPEVLNISGTFIRMIS